MIQFSQMNPINEYARRMEETFGIEGVLVLAWYILHAHRLLIEEMHMRVPYMIIEGHPGMGKTELACAIAAIDVPEGLNLHTAFRFLPSNESGRIKQLINGKASFVVLDGLSDKLPKEMLKALKGRGQNGPLVLLTSLFPRYTELLKEKSIVVKLPKRRFTEEDYRRIAEFRKTRKEAWQLQQLLFCQPIDLRENINTMRLKLLDAAKEMCLDCSSEAHLQVIFDYALVLAHWKSVGLDTDMLNRMSNYVFSCLHESMPRKTVVILERRTDEDGCVTLYWNHPGNFCYSIKFPDEGMFKAFVSMLRIMVSTGAVTLEIGCD